MKRIGSWALVLAMAAALMGCAASGPEATDPSGTTGPAATVSATDPGKATQPGDVTTPAQGGKETEPTNEGAQPSSSVSWGSTGNHEGSESGATQPKPTEPPHTHSYTTSTVAPTCTDKGYTLHKCACGDSYKDGETAALGHSFGEWTVTVEATYDAEGEQARTCSVCGATETQAIDKLEAEVIDCAALASYGISYGVSAYGFQYVPPALDVQINTMDEGYSEVAGCVAATANQLVASGLPIVSEFEGNTVRVAIDVVVEPAGGNVYWVRVYYG